MKIKGSELKLWMDEGWPGDGWCWDQEEFDDEPNPDATYDTKDLGCLYNETDLDADALSVTGLVKKWRKHRDYDIFTVTVQKSKSEEIKAAIVKLGGKVR